MDKNIKQKIFSSCSMIRWNLPKSTVTAHASTNGCCYSVKCRVCGKKQNGKVYLLKTLFESYKELEGCQH